ncbi:hypothetical protein [Aquamicrobium soli]|uniref:Uncharacterized protein n=1 Tax=Aquamicrobium soli TaxID=1811518 RepID=A0ABV7K9V5_9HYPH
MSITYPVDLLAAWPGWCTDFSLLWRQEQSRQANGRTIVKDLGSPLWQATYQSRSLSPNELDEWRARLDAMENGLQTFKGYSLSRCRPVKHPGAVSLPAGALSTVNANRKAVRASGLTGITLSVGDMLQIGTKDLHRVMEAATGDPTNEFEIRPHLWPGVGEGAAVSISRPSCTMAVVPGSVSSQADAATGRGTVSFQAIEAR